MDVRRHGEIADDYQKMSFSVQQTLPNSISFGVFARLLNDFLCVSLLIVSVIC